MWHKVKVAVIIAAVVTVLIVVFQNTQAVETRLLFLRMTLPHAVLLGGTLIIGFAIGVLTARHIASMARRPLLTSNPVSLTTK